MCGTQSRAWKEFALVNLADYEQWKARRQSEAAGAAGVVIAAQEQTPDQIAGDLNLASEFGEVTGNIVPPLPMVQENRNLFQSMIERKRGETILGSSPRLAEWMRNPENAGIARDDLQGLSWWETTLGASKNAVKRGVSRVPQAGNQALAFMANRQAADSERSFGEILHDARNPIMVDGKEVGREWVGPSALFGAAYRWMDSRGARMTPEQRREAAVQFQKNAGEWSKHIASIPMSPAGERFKGEFAKMGKTGSIMGDLSEFAQAVGNDPGAFMAFIAEVATESAPSIGVAVGTGVVTRSPSAAAVAMGTTSGLQEYGTAPAEFFEEKGIDISTREGALAAVSDPDLMRQAMERGEIRGTIIGVMDGLSGGLASKTLANNPVGNMALQMVAQAFMGAGGEAGAQLAAGQDFNIAEVLVEGLAEFASAPIEVAGMGVARVREGRAKSRDAESRRALFEELSGQAASSKTRERMPDKFRQFVEAATANGPVENVFIPADQFNEYFQSIGINPVDVVEALPGVTRDDYDAAIAGGGDLRIPTATYAAHMAGTEHDAFLMENMRFDPNEFTSREAAEFNERIEEVQQEMWAEAERSWQENERWKTFEAQIYDDMVSRLRIAGRSTEVATTEAMIYPAFYRVMAERSGMGVDEFLERYPLPQVQGAIPEGMQFKNVDEFNRTLEAARRRRAPAQDRRQSLLEFISERGGINDTGGELAARDAKEIKRGRGKKTLKLARDTSGEGQGSFAGMAGQGGGQFGVDSVAQAAIEAGFMADDPDVIAYKEALRDGTVAPDITRALWSAVDAELRGERQTSEQEAAPDTSEDDALDQIEEYLNALGMTLDDSDDAIRAAVEADRADRARQYAQDNGQPLYVVHNLSAENLRRAADLGGLAAPSLAVARGDIGFDSFGEISLIGDPSLADPKTKGVRLFNADVYSPRQPRAMFKVNGKALRAMRDKLNPVAEKYGFRIRFDDGDIERGGLSEVVASDVGKAAFLESVGEAVPIEYEDAPRPDPVAGFDDFTSTDPAALAGDPEFVAVVERKKVLAHKVLGQANRPQFVIDNVNELWGPVGEPVSRARVEALAEQVARRNAEIAAFNPGKTDRIAYGATDRALDAAIDGREGEFNSWVRDQFGDAVGAAFFENDAGRKKDYTLTNIVREMTRTIRNGENWNYGAGNVRAAVAPEFTSLKAVQDARGQIVDDKAMEALKDEVNSELLTLADKFGEYSGAGDRFGWADDFSDFLKDMAKGPRAVAEWPWASKVPDDLMAEAGAFLEKLKGLPSNYFEIKMQRAMGFDEFSAALVPSDLPSDARQILTDAGLELVEYQRGQEGARNAALQRIGSRVFFQGGSNQQHAQASGEVRSNPDLGSGPTAAMDSVISALGGEIVSRAYDEKSGFGDEAVIRANGTDLQISIREDKTGVYLTNIASKEVGDLKMVRSGSGVGTSAIRALKAYADKTGKPFAVVGSTEPARGFYDKMGMVPEDVTLFMDDGYLTAPASGEGGGGFVYRPAWDGNDERILFQGSEDYRVKPPKKLWRGTVTGQQEDGSEGLGTFMLGRGLYSSPDKKFAAMYGEPKEVAISDAWPRNPLVIPGRGAGPDLFRDYIFRNTGFRNIREFNAAYPDPADWVRSLGYDGVIAGDEVVKYPGNPDGSTAYSQGPRGLIQIGQDGQSIIRLFETANLSTMLHESGHYFLTVMQDMAARGETGAVAEYDAIKGWWRENAAAVAADGNRAMPDAALTADDVIRALDEGSTGDTIKDGALDVGMQEQWARAFEAYLMEGKAPSAELRGAFEKFRAWLISIYRRLAGLRVQMSDDIRGVFDRMLASDAEIAEAQRLAGGNEGVFATAEEMGLTQEEFDRLMKLRQQSEDDAKAKLLREIMEPIKREREKAFKEEKAKVREEVTARVNAMREFRAIEWMGNRRWLGDDQPEALPDMRLSKDILVDRYGEGVLSTLPRGRQTVYTVEGGIDPDDAAGWFGFRTGAEMIAAMERAPNRKEAITAETDREMRERHGDALNDGEIEEKALDAVHSDKRGQWIAAELKAVAEVAGVDVKLTAKDARASARQTIARMRVRDAVAAQRFLAAERKAAQEAARLGAVLAREGVWMNNARRRIASKGRAGDVAGTARQIDQANASTLNRNETVQKLIAAKRRQLMNHALYMESRLVADEIGKAERFVQKLSRASHRERIAGAGRRENAQIDYLTAIDEVLEQYDFRKLSGRAEERRGGLLRYVQAMTDAGRANELAIPDAVLQEAKRIPYKTLSVEALRGVVGTLHNLEHTALRWNEFLVNQRKREFGEARDSIVAAIDANLKDAKPSWVRGVGIIERGGEMISGYLASIQTATRVLRKLDGREDIGPAYELLKSDLDAAAMNERAKNEDATDKLQSLFDLYSKDEQRKMGVATARPELRGMVLSKWNLIAMALNMGNDGNMARLTNERARYHLKPHEVAFVREQLLDARDAKFIQGVWDLIGSYRPEIAARDRRMKGYEPAWVEPSSVTIGGVDLAGGYYPIKYDARHGGGRPSAAEASDDILASIMGGGYASAHTKDGHLKARGQHITQSLLLDTTVITTHLNEVIHDLTHSEAIVNSWRLLTDGQVERAFIDKGLQPVHKQLKLWLQDAATGQVSAGTDIGRIVSFARSGFAYSKLAFSLRTILMQPSGIVQSMVTVGKVRMLKHMLKSYSHPVETAREVESLSRLMVSRRETFNKDLMDAAAKANVASPAGSRASEFMREKFLPLGMAGMLYTQYYTVDLATWSAAYEKGMEQFAGDSAKAVQYADMTVSRSQGSGIWTDRTGIERGTLSGSIRQNPFVTLLTTLGSYFFAKMNIAGERTDALRAEPVTLQSTASYALDMMMLFAVEGMIMAAVSAITGWDDEKEDKNAVTDIAKETGKTFLAGLPLIRDLAGVVEGFDGGTYDAILGTVAKPLVQTGQLEFDLPFVKAWINLGGMVGRLPSAQINRGVDAFWRASEGEDVSLLEYFMGRKPK